MSYQQDNWIDWLAAVEFQYNSKKHAATGRTPFELNFGRHSWKGNLMVQTRIPYGITKELGTGDKSNGGSAEKYEEAV